MAGTMINPHWEHPQRTVDAELLRRLFVSCDTGVALTYEGRRLALSIDFLLPFTEKLEEMFAWSDDIDREAAMVTLLQIYLSPYQFQHNRALAAALREDDISMDAISEISPDGTSLSVQLLVEGGFPNEALGLMKKRMNTRASKEMSLHRIFEKVNPEPGVLDEWGM